MKQLKAVLCLLAAVRFFCIPALAQEIPNFAPGQYLLSDDKPILGENLYSDPCVEDFNNDGLMDVIAGEYNGKVHLYLNSGNPSDPDLTNAGYLQVKGVDISVDYYSLHVRLEQRRAP